MSPLGTAHPYTQGSITTVFTGASLEPQFPFFALERVLTILISHLIRGLGSQGCWQFSEKTPLYRGLSAPPQPSRSPRASLQGNSNCPVQGGQVLEWCETPSRSGGTKILEWSCQRPLSVCNTSERRGGPDRSQEGEAQMPLLYSEPLCILRRPCRPAQRRGGGQGSPLQRGGGQGPTPRAEVLERGLHV